MMLSLSDKGGQYVSEGFRRLVSDRTDVIHNWSNRISMLMDLRGAVNAWYIFVSRVKQLG